MSKHSHISAIFDNAFQSRAGSPDVYMSMGLGEWVTDEQTTAKCKLFVLYNKNVKISFVVRRKDFSTPFDMIMIYTKQSTPLAVDNSENCCDWLVAEMASACVCPLIDHSSRRMKIKNELLLLYKLVWTTREIYHFQLFHNYLYLEV